MKKYYAVRYKEKDVVKKSRSGGFFVGLSDYVLNKTGIIYGCAMNENNVATFIRATSKEERDKCCGSKYVQANIGNAFKMCKKDLNTGVPVLFSGTSCQVNALLKYLGHHYENLITLDILCHAVPSPKVLEKFKSHVSNKYGEPVTHIDFRNKSKYGWGADVMSIHTRNHVYDTRDFYDFFWTHLSIRPSCFNCKYHSPDRRNVDFTIGDFWGIEKICHDFADDKGTSMVICNSKKSHDIFKNVKEDFIYIEVTEADVTQPVMKGNAPYNRDRELFFNDLDTLELTALADKYLSKKRHYIMFKQRIKSIIYRVTSKWS